MIHMYDMRIVYIIMGKAMYMIRIFYMDISIVRRPMYDIHRHVHVENTWAKQYMLFIFYYVSIPTWEWLYILYIGMPTNDLPGLHMHSLRTVSMASHVGTPTYNKHGHAHV